MAFREELWQDIKGLSGVPIFISIILVSFLLGNVLLAARLSAGLVLAYVVTIIIRALYFRQRPDKEKYRGFVEKIDASSFPSLHAMRAGVLATNLALFFNNGLLTLFFASCAVGVAVSRVMLKRHFVVDVAAGLVLGFLIGFAVVRLISI